MKIEIGKWFRNKKIKKLAMENLQKVLDGFDWMTKVDSVEIKVNKKKR